MTRSENNPWLHRFAVLTALATLFLIGIGGVVTSKGAGLAVPDWPTTYGYNMFLFPFSKMVGGIFYEHSHRLAGSVVGLLTIILAVWLSLRESRRWLRTLGWVALGSVVLQGVLGGLRVVWLKDEIGILHACLAQSYLVLICAIALFTSKSWRQLPAPFAAPGSQRLRTLGLTLTVIVFIQLALGATMRHEHAGLSIPDFPLAYGKVVPPLDAQSIQRINYDRQFAGLPETTAAQILLQMVHRITAFLILGMAVWLARVVRKRADLPEPVRVLGRTVLALVLFQVVLGVSTIWSNKAADVATAHVVVGALTLAALSLLTIVAFRLFRATEGPPVFQSQIENRKSQMEAAA
jgi:cytochrome c oxidase assembly protein subunit 15